MELFSCEHPVRVYNKYLDEYVWANCGKCNACKKRRASRWVARLERERACRQFTLFCTLTYDEHSLPLLKFDSSTTNLVDVSHDVSIPYDELEFSSAADKQYFDSRMALGGIPYASVVDIQKFHKRLNKWFHDNVTQTYNNFRYFAVSEFGSTTLRPHFHQIYFTDSNEVASRFAEGVLACWRFGRSDTQYVEKSAASYVAQYLNKLFDLPSFYNHRSLRPFFVCSKRPPIGGDMYNEEEFEDIFRNSRISTVRQVSASDTRLSDVPLLPCVENRLFPRIKAFGRISHSLRVAVYGIVAKGWSWYRDFNEFKWSIFYRCRNASKIVYCSDVYKYLSLIIDGMSEKGVNSLRRLYYISKRCITTCLRYHCSVEYYVERIEDYWNKKQLSVLRQFYLMQMKYDDPECLVFAYPEFAFQNADCLIDKSDLGVYQSFVSDNATDNTKRTKTHFKNAYFESLNVRNKPVFQILLTYLYAKECYEVAQTYAE